jgi:hypothetical protein
MAFDKPTRNALAKMVAACREQLTADISNQLQSTFGLYPDGTRLDVARTEADKRATAELRALLDYFIASDASGAKNIQNAYQRLVREIGFTTLNRLAALRLSEERGLVIECVRHGMDSDGFRLFDRVAKGALGTRYATYRAFIEGMYDELALELPALFDRHHPHSHVFPGEIALNEVLALLNDPDLSQREIWKQDETIGWIYQYYNDPAERKKMRDESQAPRNSRELAVRNQFFTPRYVVEFLTDNTLGRIWFEMRSGETELTEICRYLVKTSPIPEGDRTGVREKKDPRDLKILDPACGSGHFLLYAFDLLLRIYEEAWQDINPPQTVETGTLLRDDYPDLESLRHAAPGLILRYNLHGIDIDPRAAQIAALALWLRAQRAYLELSLKPDERPAIQKTNIVTAEPMPGDPALLEDFLATVELPFIQKLVRDVFDKMALAGEAGSLLKIEEEIRDSIATAKQAWLKRPKTEQLSLWQEEQQPQAEQLAMFEGITDASFWEQAEQRVLDALHDYARHAENGKGTRRRLFVDDAEHGFAFIDLCRKNYSVVLMNPPFGEASKTSRLYINKQYPSSKLDLYACFVDRMLGLAPNGFTGCISARTGFYLSSMTKWRLNLFKKFSLLVFTDLGGDVLDDAMVETASYIISSKKEGLSAIAFKLDQEEEKAQALINLCNDLSGKNIFHIDPESCIKLPGAPFAYWLPNDLRRIYTEHLPFQDNGGDVKSGVQTDDDFRFVRTWWEVSSNNILNPFSFPKPLNWNSKEIQSTAINLSNSETQWITFVKGGLSSRYHSDFDLVILWKNNAVELKAATFDAPGGRVNNENVYFLPGLSWALRTDYFSPHLVPALCIPSISRYIVLPKDDLFLYILGIWNSDLFDDLCKARMEKWLQPKFIVGVIQELPWKEPSEEIIKMTSEFSLSAWKVQQQKSTLDELSRLFISPQKAFQNITGQSQDNTLEKIKNELDTIAADFFGAARAKRFDFENDNWNVDITEIANKDTNIVIRIVQYLLGCGFGRWDVRLAIDSKFVPHLPKPLDPLPACPVGMLVGSNGLPSTHTNIASDAWLQARADGISLPAIGGTIKKPTVEWQGRTYPATIPDEEYPVKIAWDGILVDDPGLDGRTLHPSDIVRRVREVLEVLWPENHAEIEAEACQILGIKDLRDYFRKPSGFFADHLKRYSKSRRQAPIYWPLSTPSGSYTLWIYYHRLSDEILFTAVNRYVDPKIAQVERSVNAMQTELGQLSGKSATEMRDQLDELREFLSELRQFREELLRIANLPYKPDLNDGVILNAAPFYRLFRLNKWAKDTESAWKKLAAGEYDWAHIAYVLWPDRVRTACKSDKSIAIAHGLESLYEGKEEAKKRRKKSKKDAEEQEEIEME